MAEIFDIVAQLSYDVENGGLKQALDLLNEQLNTIGILTNRLSQLNKIKNQLAADDVASLNRVNGLIAQQKKVIEDVAASINNQISNNKRLQDAIVKQAGAISSLTENTGKFKEEVEQAGDLLRKLASGEDTSDELITFLDSVIEKVVELAIEGKSATAIIGTIGASFLGIQGVIGLALIGLQLFGGELVNTSGKVADLSKYTDALAATNERAAGFMAEETGKLVALRTEVENGETSHKRLLEIRDEFVNKYPSFRKNLEDETNLRFNLANAINLTTKAIQQQAIISAAQELLTETTKKYLKNETSTWDNFVIGVKSAFMGLPSAIASTVPDIISRNEKEYQDGVAHLVKIIGDTNAKLQKSGLGTILQGPPGTNNSSGFSAKPDPYKVALDNINEQGQEALQTNEALKLLKQSEIKLNQDYEALYNSDREQKRIISQEERLAREQSYRKKQEQIKIQEELLLNEQNQSLLEQQMKLAETYKKAKDVANFRAQLEELQIQHSELQLRREQGKEIIPSLDAEPNPFTEPRIPQPKPIAVPEFQIEDIQKTEDIQQKKLAIVKKYAKEAVQYTIQGLNTIFDAQIKSLDKEIAIRKERVSQATELAKRGNKEALNAETERLQKAEEEREKAVKKQLALNALVKASEMALVVVQALKTITNAGAKGDPYTIAIRIAAAVAALAAGFAAVSQLTSAFKGFAEGGYTGQGDKYQPAGTVHKGEFVFNKEMTARYREQFEAMHKGIDPAFVFNPKLIPVIHSGNATKIELSTLEKKMDTMIDALQGREVNVNQKMDAYGLSQSVETYKRLDRNRFK